MQSDTGKTLPRDPLPIKIFMNILKSALNEKLWLFLSCALISVYVLLATWANFDLSAGRFALFMDERITFDGVRHILHPEGIKDFVLSVVHGGDHRYGRSLWNSIAIFSFIPERLFGETGQIIAGRTTQVVILISAFVLLTITMVKHWFFRFLLLATLLAMPYTAYYMGMPKPEPLQILFIAIFLLFFKKNSMSLKGRYWIFLGLAFGTKISTLPIVLVIFSASFIYYWKIFDYKKFTLELTATLGYFLLGLAIAVPILVPHLIVSILVFRCLIEFIKNKFEHYQWAAGMICVITLIFLNSFASAFLVLKFRLKTPLSVWFQSTFLSTNHSSDSISINFASWVHYLFSSWLIAPTTLTYLAIGLTFSITVYAARRALTLPIIVILSGLVLNLAIFIAVHRLWGLYIFPGTILMAVGVYSLFEFNIININKSNKKDELLVKFVNSASLFNLLIFVIICTFWWLPGSLIEYKANASRSKQLDYFNQYRSYLEITNFLTKYSDNKLMQINVAYDPWLFIPYTTHKYKIIEFWWPYTFWQDKSDVIVLSAERRKGRDMAIDSPEYRDFKLDLDGYARHVVNARQQCTEAPCYVKQIALPNGGEILTLRN